MPSRDRVGASLYNSSRWRTGRLSFLRDNPLCAHCARRGRVVEATEVDHVKAHRGDEALFFDVSNWAALCVRCHSAKTVGEDRGFGRAPGSSKPRVRIGRDGFPE